MITIDDVSPADRGHHNNALLSRLLLLVLGFTTVQVRSEGLPFIAFAGRANALNCDAPCLKHFT